MNTAIIVSSIGAVISAFSVAVAFFSVISSNKNIKKTLRADIEYKRRQAWCNEFKQAISDYLSLSLVVANEALAYYDKRVYFYAKHRVNQSNIIELYDDILGSDVFHLSKSNHRMNNAVGLIKLSLSEIDNNAKDKLISIMKERKQLFYDLNTHRNEIMEKEINLFIKNAGINKEEKEINILKRLSSSVDDIFEIADEILRDEKNKNKI